MYTDKVKEEVRLRLMKTISEADQKITQRVLAKSVGISLGKTNYWVTEMVNEGLVKFEPFKQNGNKSAFTYVLTPKGSEEKFRLLIHFLSRKLREYDILQKEIEDLNQEILEYKNAPDAHKLGNSSVKIGGDLRPQSSQPNAPTAAGKKHD
jgi:EPS-associated MarR family transcriptional regulator